MQQLLMIEDDARLAQVLDGIECLLVLLVRQFAGQLYERVAGLECCGVEGGAQVLARLDQRRQLHQRRLEAGRQAFRFLDALQVGWVFQMG